MAQVELAELTTWLHQGSKTPVIDAHTLEARLPGVFSLVFPEKVCDAVGLSVLEEALPKGLLGPPEAARSILLNSQLFSEDDADHSTCERIRGGPSLTRVEATQEDAAHHPRSVWIDICRRFEKALFDSSSVTRVSLLLAAAARVLFSWLPSLPLGVEFVTFYLFLLAVCANRCAVRQSLRSSFAMSLTNGILHLVLVLASRVLPIPVSFSLSSVTQLAALGVMLTSYVEPYFFRFVSQSVALSLVLFDGFMTPADKYDLEAMCPTERSFSSSTALTLVLCLILSSFMSETVQYTKRKSYSGK